MIRRVASLVWDPHSQLHELQGAEIEALGYEHQYVVYDQRLPVDVDVVLVQGPYGTLAPLTAQLLNRAHADRPVLVYWFQQSLEARGPLTIRAGAGRMLADLERRSTLGLAPPSSISHRLHARIAHRATRLRFLGDIVHLHRLGVLDVLALSSSVYAAELLRLGIPSLVVPRGFHPAYGEERGHPRDIAVVWMGKTRTRRRRQLVYGLRDALATRGLAMRIHDGLEAPFVFAESRTDLLNRTHFVLNAHFASPADELSIRFVVAAANGAVVLTEPGFNDYPFVSGEHWVESPAEQWGDVVADYVRRPDALRRIAGNMRRLMETELTLRQSLSEIMTLAEQARHRQRAMA